MKISLDRLKQEQKIFLDKEIIKFNDTDLRENFSGEIEISLILSWVRSTVPAVKLKGSLTGKLNLVCDRCMEAFVRELNYKIDDIYELEKEDVLKKVIDVGSKIRDFILNNLPMKILCKESCKGICIKCNTNLNKEVCKCRL
ncbi:MAG: DUF177 domain-containing protein [Endomicrobiia bacterium]